MNTYSIKTSRCEITSIDITSNIIADYSKKRGRQILVFTAPPSALASWPSTTKSPP